MFGWMSRYGGIVAFGLRSMSFVHLPRSSETCSLAILETPPSIIRRVSILPLSLVRHALCSRVRRPPRFSLVVVQLLSRPRLRGLGFEASMVLLAL